MTSINDRPFPKHVKFGYLNLIVVYKRQEFKFNFLLGDNIFENTFQEFEVSRNGP
jgi:hypothetical protein